MARRLVRIAVHEVGGVLHAQPRLYVDDAWTGRGEKYDSFGVFEYRGGFRSGVYHGYGTLYKDGKKWIHGYWREGKPVGIMKEYMDGVLVYKGEMKDMERDGVGCVFYGKMCYEGEFICGKINLNRVNVYEILQLVLKRGLFEFDDIMNNSIGCMLGCMFGNLVAYLLAGKPIWHRDR